MSRSTVLAVLLAAVPVLVALAVLGSGGSTSWALTVAGVSLAVCAVCAALGWSRGVRTGHGRALAADDDAVLSLAAAAAEHTRTLSSVGAMLGAGHPAIRPADYLDAEARAQEWAADAERVALAGEPDPVALSTLAEVLDLLADTGAAVSSVARAAIRRRALSALMAARAAGVDLGPTSARALAALDRLDPAQVVDLDRRRVDSGPPGSTTLDRLPPSTLPRSGLPVRVHVPRARLAIRAIPTGPPV